MAEPICRLVANVFYRGRLRVADDSKASAGWLADRRLMFDREVKETALHRLEIAELGAWHAGWKGNVRFESAERIARICRRLELSESDDIVVLTPFRAQRQLIKVKLEEAGARSVDVWTVRRAQGS